MCQQYEYQQVQCGQCHNYHGPRIYINLQNICRTAKQAGAFGACGRAKKCEIRRAGWRDCRNCSQRFEVHNNLWR